MLVHAGKELCLLSIVVAVRVSKFVKARVHANTNSDADVSARGPTPPSRRVHRDATQQHILEDAGGVRARRVEQRRADNAVSCVDDAKYCAAASHRPEIQHEQQCPVARILRLLPCHLKKPGCTAKCQWNSLRCIAKVNVSDIVCHEDHNI